MIQSGPSDIYVTVQAVIFYPQQCASLPVEGCAERFLNFLSWWNNRDFDLYKAVKS